MKKRKKLFQRFLIPIIMLALVVTGVFFQGIQMLEAAEMDDVLNDKIEDLEIPEKIDEMEVPEEAEKAPEKIDETEVPEETEAPEKIDETETPEETKEPEKADSQLFLEGTGEMEETKETDYLRADRENQKADLEDGEEVEEEEEVKKPGKPVSVKVTWKGKKRVTITWKKASNATRYVVYRSVKSSTKGFKEIAEVKRTNYTDEAATPGKVAYYKVLAYNGSVKGSFSKVKRVYIVKQPARVSAKVSNRAVVVTFKASQKASGYDIWRKTGKKGKYKRVALLKSGKSVKRTFKDQKGGTYYYKVRAYKKYGTNTKKIYTDFGKQVKVNVPVSRTIENTKSKLTIEGDIKLTGSGSGYHAKLVMATPTSAVSFGIQYDQHAVAPYTGKAMALIENIDSNNPGGQRYTRPGNKSLKLNKTYHYMMTLDDNGNGDVYLDYQKIGSFSQPNLVKENCYLRIEACARLDGDTVKATFSNIKCKWQGKYDSHHVLGNPSLTWTEFKQNDGLNYTYNRGKNPNIQIFGTVQGLGPGKDWDNDYNHVQDILQFQGPY